MKIETLQKLITEKWKTFVSCMEKAQISYKIHLKFSKNFHTAVMLNCM